ncbi:DUF5131 family protein [Ottowia sp.]|uniref:DUF5131 family protein n=1 Tax=Ottowia sp. TaxID=1898956 RepID=UPI0025E1B3BD|nr:DUF5131 family protein [Ottowia sp.]
MRHEASHASWADRSFNPWLGSTRSVGLAAGFVASLSERVAIGSRDEALQWNASASAFAACHEGRRQRVFAGPWCAPLDDRDVSKGEERDCFWGLVRDTPELDWLVIAKMDDSTQLALPEDWGDGYQNVWVGCKLSVSCNAAGGLRRLRQVPASLRFVLVKPGDGDLGDLDLSGVGWLVIIIDESEPPPDPDWVASVRLQAMYSGVAVWFERWNQTIALHDSQG